MALESFFFFCNEIFVKEDLKNTGLQKCLFSLPVGLEPPPLSVSEERHLAILTELPFVVPFEERVKVCCGVCFVPNTGQNVVIM